MLRRSARHRGGATQSLPVALRRAASIAKAVVDRLTHRAHIIDTGSESWRFRHGLARTTKKTT